MKNKKLFAILTLVCFMFTLMPVAAFAADGELNDTYITSQESTELNIAGSTTNTVYVFAVKDGAIYRDLEVEGATAANGVVTVTDAAVTSNDGKNFTLVFKNAGTYTVYVAEATGQGLDDIVTGKVFTTPSELLEIMLGESKASAAMKKNVVTVKVAEGSYAITPVGGTWVSEGTPAVSKLQITANNGFTNDGVLVLTLTENNEVVKGAKLSYSTLGYVTATAIDAETDRNGQAKVKISASKAGDFKVFVKYNNYTLEIPVKAVTTGAEVVTAVAQPKAPVALGTEIFDLTAIGGGEKPYSGVVFAMADGNGFAVTGASDAYAGTGDYTVNVIAKPADSALGTTGNEVSLKYVANLGGYVLIGRAGTVEFDAEGDYTFRVALENGAAATAKVTVKEFAEPVAIKFANAPTTVAYDSQIDVAPHGIVAVDANGVTKEVNADSYSVNGKAVLNFAVQTLNTKDDEDYIGSTITVIAVYTDNGKTFTTTNELTVVDKASGVVYTNTDAEVAVNNVFYANVVDANGDKVDLTNLIVGEPTAIVLDTPNDNAIAVAVASYDTVKKMVKLEFTASAAGEYKVQTMVNFNENGNKYISSITTFTVGADKDTFKDVIVMSIGAKQLVKNDTVVAMPAAPEIVDSRTMVPARAGLEAFGATVVWDEATQTVTAELNGVKVVMTIGEKAYTVNGKAVVGDAAPYITAASTMVPVSFFTNAFGIVATPIYDANGVSDVLFTK